MKIYLHLALAYLGKQKGRTFTLIAGVALAVMLVFGFNVINESQSKNQLETIYKLYGSYQAEFTNLDMQIVDKIERDDDISKVCKAANLGDIVDDKGISIKLNSGDKDFIEKQGYTLKQGNLPKKQGEIILESQSLEKMGLKEDLNQTIYFNVKKEYVDENGVNQIFTKNQQFKLVGILEKPSQYYNDWYALRGFISFEENGKNIMPNNLINYDGVVNLKAGSNQINDNLNKIIKKYNIGRLDFKPNTKLITALEDYTLAQNSKSKESIKVLVTITSIFLIYNLFNISLNEMINQIGMLRTVGASKKHVRMILGFQSFIIMILGIVSGLLIGIIFSYLGMKIFNFTGTSIDTSISKVYISRKSLLNSINIGVISIVVSSIIPIWIAGRISPLEALRKTDRSNKSPNIRLHHKFIRKIFGISGEMAYKNVWRNKFRTIVSIASISLGGILFIHNIASSKSDWIENTNVNIASMQDNDFKLSYGENIDKNIAGYTNKDIEKMSNIDGVKEIKTKVEVTGFLKSSIHNLNSDFKKYNGILDNYNSVETALQVKAYDNKQLKEFGKFIDKGDLLSLNEKSDEYPNAIVFNYYYDILEDHKLEEVRKGIKIGDIIDLKIPVIKGNSIIYEDHKVRVAALLKPEWMFKGDSTLGRYFEMIIPQNDLINISGKSNFTDIKIVSEKGKDKQVYKELDNIIKDKPFSVMDSRLKHEMEDDVSTKENLKSNMVIVTLILLIAVLNIFCTIRTNLLIRTSEFSTLRAIGMTIKQIKSMIIKESLIYGVLSSIIAAVLGSYKNYKFLERVNADYSQGMGMSSVATFKLPIVEILQFSTMAIIICIVAVYISKRKIEKLNIIEGLKINE